MCLLRPAGGGCWTQKAPGRVSSHLVCGRTFLFLSSARWMQEAECFLLWVHFRCSFPALLDALCRSRGSLFAGKILLPLNKTPNRQPRCFQCGVQALLSEGQGPGFLSWELRKESPSSGQHRGGITRAQALGHCEPGTCQACPYLTEGLQKDRNLTLEHVYGAHLKGLLCFSLSFILVPTCLFLVPTSASQ